MRDEGVERIGEQLSSKDQKSDDSAAVLLEGGKVEK
jgi:hypothetical protein